MDLTIYHCGEAYHTDSSNIGKSFRCRKCGESIPIEAAAISPPEEAAKPHIPNSSKPIAPSPSSSKLSREAKATIVSGVGFLILIIIIFGYHFATEIPTVPSKSIPLPEAPKLIHIPRYEIKPKTVIPELVESPLSTESDLQVRSLPNGTDIVESLDASGEGKLTVVNGTNYDAFVKLSEGGAVRQEKYVTAGNVVTFANIADCVCQVIFGTGVDFDGKTFTRDDSYMAFDDPFVFRTAITAQEHEDFIGYTYRSTHASITLHTVPRGNAPAHRISKDTFRAANLVP